MIPVPLKAVTQTVNAFAYWWSLRHARIVAVPPGFPRSCQFASRRRRLESGVVHSPGATGRLRWAVVVVSGAFGLIGRAATRVFIQRWLQLCHIDKLGGLCLAG